MLHLVCECQPLQTQHFFIFLFASFGMWLLIRLFANLRYSYSINSSLVHSFWYFWLATLAFKCQLASSARRAARSALPGAGPTVSRCFLLVLSLSPAWTKNAVPPVLPIIKARRLSRAAYVTFHHWIKWVSFQKIKDDILRVLYIKANLKNLWKRGIFNADLKLKQIVNASKKNSL